MAEIKRDEKGRFTEGRLKGNPELARELGKLSNDSQRRYREWIEASLKQAGKDAIPEYLKPAVKSYWKGEATAKERDQVIDFLKPAGTPKPSRAKKSAPGMTYKQALEYIKAYKDAELQEKQAEEITRLRATLSEKEVQISALEREVKRLKNKSPFGDNNQ